MHTRYAPASRTTSDRPATGCRAPAKRAVAPCGFPALRTAPLYLRAAARTLFQPIHFPHHPKHHRLTPRPHRPHHRTHPPLPPAPPHPSPAAPGVVLRPAQFTCAHARNRTSTASCTTLYPAQFTCTLHAPIPRHPSPAAAFLAVPPRPCRAPCRQMCYNKQNRKTTDGGDPHAKNLSRRAAAAHLPL